MFVFIRQLLTIIVRRFPRLAAVLFSRRFSPCELARSLVDRESERTVRYKTLGVHPGQNRNVDIHVVMHLDSRLRCRSSKYAADVLDDPALERQRKCQEERVQLREVETFAEEAPSRHQDESAVGSPALHLYCRCGSNLLTHAPSHHDRIDPAVLECTGQLLDVLGPLRQDQAVSSSCDGIGNVACRSVTAEQREAADR